MATKIEVLKATILSLGGSFDDIDATDEAALSKRLIEVCGKLQNPGGGSGGSGLPTGGEPYQQLVTDGEGNAVWEERLAYEDISAVVIPETTLTPLEEMGNMGIVFDAPLTPPISGETYLITYNGTPYLCTAYGMDDDGDGVDEMVFIGNMGLMGGDDTGEPFVGMMLADLETGAAEGYYGGFMHNGGLEPFTISMAQATIKKVDSKFIDLSDHYTKAKTDELLSAYLPKAEYEEENNRKYEQVATIDLTGKADSGVVDIKGCKKLFFQIRSTNVATKCGLQIIPYDSNGEGVGGGNLPGIIKAQTSSTYFDKVWLYMDGGNVSVMDILEDTTSATMVGLKRVANMFSSVNEFTEYNSIQIKTMNNVASDAEELIIYVYGM